MLDSRELTYATSAKSRAGRAVVRTIENLTGRRRLLRALQDYQSELGGARTFWEVMWDRFDLKLELPGAGLANIPSEGPVVCVANHPYGIVDGLALGMVLSKARGRDFKMLANQWLVPAPEIMGNILPVERDETREAMRVNLATRRAALAELKGGGCIGVFPAGTIAAGRKIYKRRAFDPSWKTFTASMIGLGRATVVPMFFEGQNSRAFQIASHINPTLRLSLLINEFRNRVGDTIRLVIGEPIPFEELKPQLAEPGALMAHLRRRTYTLSESFFDELTAGKPWEGPADRRNGAY